MKSSKYSEPQILSILRQADGGVPVPELCREHGMSSASFYKWRAKFGGMDASMISQMKSIGVRPVSVFSCGGKLADGLELMSALALALIPDGAFCSDADGACLGR